MRPTPGVGFRPTSVSLKPVTAPGFEHPSVCPHCWNVNPGPFRICARCGASMESFLQESGGLRRTAPVQSPVPVSGRLPLARRLLIGCLVVLLVLAYLLYLLPAPAVRFAIATAAAGGV